MKILYGKRTTLFPFEAKDVEFFHALLKHEGHLLGEAYFKSFESYFAYVTKQILDKQMFVWSAWTKDGKASKKIGFMVISDFSPFTVSVEGLMDKSVMKGLLPLLKREDKYTYSEDCLATIVNHCFENLKIHRVEAKCFEKNRLARKLLEKAGFEKEGKLRDAAFIENKFENVFLFAKLNKEQGNGTETK